MKRKRPAIFALALGLAIPLMTHGVILEEDLMTAPNDSGAPPVNGWLPVANNDSPNNSGRTNADGGKLEINTFGQSTVGISYTQLNASPFTGVQFVNAELIADVARSQAPAAPDSDGLGVALGIDNGIFQYAMGVKVADLGGNMFQPTVVLFHRFGGGQPVPLATFSLPAETGIQIHRYTSEFVGSIGDLGNSTMNVYVDAFQGDAAVISVPGSSFVASGSHSLIFGDIRSTGEADGNIYHVRFSDGDSFLPAPPDPPTLPNIIASRITDTSAITFSSVLGHMYTLQISTTQPANVWSPNVASVVGDGNMMSMYDPTGYSASKNYRVLTLSP